MGKPWLKLWTEIRHDRKLLRLSATSRWCWIGLLTLAAERDDAGRLELTAGVPYTDADLAAEFAVTLDEWTAAAAAFRQLNMLSLAGDCYILTNYVKRQRPADPTGAQRQQSWRDGHLPAAAGPAGNGVSADAPARVTVTPASRVEAEAESELELESEAEGEAEAVVVEAVVEAEAAATEKATTAAAARPALADALPVFTALASRKIEAVCGPLAGAAAGREMTQMAADLYDAGRSDWLDGALDEAAAMNKRNWRYVRAILHRCLQDHQPPGAPPAGSQVPPATYRPRGASANPVAARGSERSPWLSPALEAARRLALRQQSEAADGR